MMSHHHQWTHAKFRDSDRNKTQERNWRTDSGASSSRFYSFIENTTKIWTSKSGIFFRKSDFFSKFWDFFSGFFLGFLKCSPNQSRIVFFYFKCSDETGVWLSGDKIAGTIIFLWNFFMNFFRLIEVQIQMYTENKILFKWFKIQFPNFQKILQTAIHTNVIHLKCEKSKNIVLDRS